MNQHDAHQGAGGREGDVEEGLARLAGRLAPPAAEQGEDLARGVRRARRRTAGAWVASLAAVAVVGTGVWSISGSDTQALDPAGSGSPAGEAAPTGAASADATPSSGPSAKQPVLAATMSAEEREKYAHDMERAFPRQMKLFNEHWLPVIGSVVDPSGGHLDAEASNVQSGFDSGVGVGTKLGWRNPGKPGLGVVQVYLQTEALPGCAEQQTECTQLPTPPGARGAWSWTEGDMQGVRVLRADGTAVDASSDALFGNNSRVAVAATPVDQATLLDLAANPDLAMPPGMEDLLN